ncbi:MAG: hypothetical protein JJU36_05715 [Phycisphaeraceae bacterium]|nr:hypothetical protein [Phycisphaeraceae bacterium]
MSGMPPSAIGRTSTLMKADLLSSALRKTQSELMRREIEMSTLMKVHRPSDAPADTANIQYLQGMMEKRRQWDRNLEHASGMLGVTDVALGDVTDILLDAKGIASGQIGVGSNADTRLSQAAIIDGQLQAVMEIANRKYAGVSLFGGLAGGRAGEMFESFMGGVRYRGDTSNLATQIGLNRPLEINSNGMDAFGAVSARVSGIADLQPLPAANTRLSDLDGAQGLGVRRGEIHLRVNGVETMVDLTSAETVGDVAVRIHAAIEAIDPTAGGFAFVPGQSGFSFTASPGSLIRIEDPAGGRMAKDLGIDMAVSATTAPGDPINPRLTMLTRLSDLEHPVDLSGGLKITVGATTRIADFSSAQTIQDLVNEINRLDMGLRLEINQAKRGLSLYTDVSGVEVSIGENGGGTTARDLGLRSFGEDTLLADFQFGLRGVTRVQGEDDFRVELKDGRAFEVNMDGAITVGDVLEKMRQSALAAGIAIGDPGNAASELNIGLALDGNGFRLEDNTTGGGEFAVRTLGLSLAAVDLGIAHNAGSGDVIQGKDMAKVRVESVFTHLIHLRDALATNDERGIVFAGDRMEGDIEQLARVRAEVGVRGQLVAQHQERSADLNVQEHSQLSLLRDADMTESISRYMQLTQQLQATMQTGSLGLQTSLLDFLR